MAQHKHTVRGSQFPDSTPQTVAANPQDSRRWPELVAMIGRDIAIPLTTALERVNALTTSGQIGRGSLKALKDELTQAREVGIASQQLSRFAAERLRQSREPFSLGDMLSTLLTHRAREIHARGMTVTSQIIPIDILVDGPLLFSMLNSVMDWAMRHAHSNIHLSLDHTVWPVHGRLNCRFHAHIFEDSPQKQPSVPDLDSLSWRLIEQTAWAMELPLSRTQDDTLTLLTLEFPRTVCDDVNSVSSVDLDQGFALSTNAEPLAGRHVLIAGARRELRVEIRNAIKNMGLIIDHVGSIEEAEEFCKDGLPHAIVFEGVLRGDKLSRLHDEISGKAPDFAWIEITEEGTAFEMSGFDGAHMASVGRDGIADSLPSVLMFELSRAL